MEALRGAGEPAPEPGLWPASRPQRNDPGCLHEEHAQITVAPLGDAPEDGSVSGRHLLRDEADPGRKISSSCECRATADRTALVEGFTRMAATMITAIAIPTTTRTAVTGISGGGASRGSTPIHELHADAGGRLHTLPAAVTHS